MSDEQKTMSGQVALVTGGGRGLGRAIAQALAAAGATVVVTARSSDELAETVDVIKQDGGQAHFRTLDVTDRAAVESTIKDIESSIGQIHILVNNAGIGGAGGNFWEVDPVEWWRVQEVNLRGVMLCTRYVLPGMIQRKNGRIINVGSNAAVQTAPGTAYGTSKAALLRFAENLASTTREHGVFVFTFSPGLVRTAMTEAMWQRQGDERDESAWTPAERGAELVAFLASGRADKLTGRYIHVREDDVREILNRVEQIERDDLHTLRIRK